MVRGRLRSVLVAGSAVGACAAAALAGTVSAAPNQPVPTLAGNQRAARQDAPKLLKSLRLPPGATALPAEPSGDGGWLKPLPGLVATTARADVHAWWQLPGSPDSVIAYIEAHAPAGSTLSSSGSGGGGPSGTSEESLSYRWPAIRAVIGSRELAVTVTSLQANVAGVLAQAESEWIVPRPASEQIPAGVNELDVASAKFNGPTTLARSVTNPGEVRAIVSLIDAMPIVQPVAYSCPALMTKGARLLTFGFRGRSGGPLLAQATYVDYPPLTAPSGPCSPIGLRIRGRRQDPLIGGNFVAQAQRILGVSLIGG